jgi:catechol 2,3-dioxygenase-like lactoylglutathione lyase family enzyme
MPRRSFVTIELNHTIVPARDKDKSARFFADIFGLTYDGASGHFASGQMNDRLTFDFDEDDSFESHHYAFHVSDDEFDAIFQRVQQALLTFGSHPWDAENRKLNDWNGGRGVYFRDPNGHLLELLTRP